MLVQSEWYIKYREIRTKFPNPTVVREKVEHVLNYCILGAIGRYVGPVDAYGIEELPSLFPGPHAGAVILQKLNPKLDTLAAHQYSHTIMMLNDNRLFEEAWETVTEAMSQC